MKNCTRIPDIPFSLDNNMHSVITVSENCLEQLKRCIILVKLLARLESYLKEQNTTRVMLVLIQYGNKEEFIRKVYSAIEELERKKEAFKEYSINIDKAVLSPTYDCEECQGKGSKEKQEIFRERGSPPQLIFRTFLCNSCKGSGKKLMKKELKKALDVFSEKMKQILNLLSDSLELMRNSALSSTKTILTLSAY